MTTSMFNTQFNMQTAFILLVCLLLAGCPLDGDDGRSGYDGAAGISCWDLNENGSKDMPDEDTNNDGKINVLDCRAPINISSSSVVVDTDSATISHQHSRTAAATYKTEVSQRVILTDITLDDYETLLIQGNFLAMDAYLKSPIEDPCGLWEWQSIDDHSNNFALTAKSGIATSIVHYPAVTVPQDINDPPQAGFELCESSCLSNELCVGAFFVRESNTDNTIRCSIVENSPNVQNASFRAMVTNTRGFVAANILTDPISTGVISVCELP